MSLSYYEAPVVKSPCVSKCSLNELDVCQGCFRTALEITDWVMYSDKQKKQVLANCERRKALK